MDRPSSVAHGRGQRVRARPWRSLSVGSAGLVIECAASAGPRSGLRVFPWRRRYVACLEALRRFDTEIKDMETAWPLLLFLAGLFGSALLILVCGLQSRDEERKAAPEAAVALAPERSFFATLSEAFEPPPQVAEAVIRSMEQRLRRQTEAANRFVEYPSVARFHDVVEPTTLDEWPLFQRVQTFLARERALACAFVADPSLDRLHGQLPLAA